jgi:predicted PurR-regulated permease PerM
VTALPAPGRDSVRATLGVLFLLVLAGACVWILRPVMPAILWSSAIVISTWPVLTAVERRLGGRRTLAAAVMTVLLTLVLIVPLMLGVFAIVDNASAIGDWLQSLSTAEMPGPPAWLERVPIAGERLAATWHQIVDEGARGMLARLGPFGKAVMTWVLSRVGGAGMVLVQFALTIVGVVFLYRHGEIVGARIRSFARRLAGEQGDEAVVLAAQTTRSVALGVLLTAIVQALLAALGLLVAGIPAVGILIVAMIVTGIAQLGPMPVLLPAVAWLYWRGDVFWGTALLVWSGFVGVIDNVLRPMFIRRGVNLSMMMVFVGVIGGLAAFGVVGLFIGPVVLAVTYRLLEAWVAREEPAATSEKAPSVKAPATAGSSIESR